MSKTNQPPQLLLHPPRLRHARFLVDWVSLRLSVSNGFKTAPTNFVLATASMGSTPSPPAPATARCARQPGATAARRSRRARRRSSPTSLSTRRRASSSTSRPRCRGSTSPPTTGGANAARRRARRRRDELPADHRRRRVAQSLAVERHRRGDVDGGARPEQQPLARRAVPGADDVVAERQHLQGSAMGARAGERRAPKAA